MLTCCRQNATVMSGTCGAGLTWFNARIIMTIANPDFGTVSSDDQRVTYSARITCATTRADEPSASCTVAELN